MPLAGAAKNENGWVPQDATGRKHEANVGRQGQRADGECCMVVKRATWT